MKRSFAVFLLAFCMPAMAMEPRDVERLVNASGASAAVAKVWQSPANAQQLLAGVASADPAWVKVGLLLAPATDAGSAEELDDAFAAALLAAPYALLPQLRTRWWPHSAQLCHFEPDSDLPGGANKYVRRLSMALERQYVPANKAIRAECRRGIQSSIAASANARR